MPQPLNTLLEGDITDLFLLVGYSANNAQLMSVPPYVLACLFTIGASRLADRFRQRGIFLLGFQLVAILGFSLLVVSGNPTVQYAGTVFAAIGECQSCGV